MGTFGHLQDYQHYQELTQYDHDSYQQHHHLHDDCDEHHDDYLHHVQQDYPRIQPLVVYRHIGTYCDHDAILLIWPQIPLPYYDLHDDCVCHFLT
jgi:hypothetical protein